VISTIAAARFPALGLRSLADSMAMSGEQWLATEFRRLPRARRLPQPCSSSVLAAISKLSLLRQEAKFQEFLSAWLVLAGDHLSNRLRRFNKRLAPELRCPHDDRFA